MQAILKYRYMIHAKMLRLCAHHTSILYVNCTVHLQHVNIIHYTTSPSLCWNCSVMNTCTNENIAFMFDDVLLCPRNFYIKCEKHEDIDEHKDSDDDSDSDSVDPLSANTGIEI